MAKTGAVDKKTKTLFNPSGMAGEQLLPTIQELRTTNNIIDEFNRLNDLFGITDGNGRSVVLIC